MTSNNPTGGNESSNGHGNAELYMGRKDSSTSLVSGKRSKSSNKSNGGQNLNHLLNFSLPPRQSHTLHSLPRRSKKLSSGYGVWNKEKFVNAQYRFVMKPSGDYTVHFADPDIFFQWQDILQVIIPRSSASTSTTGYHNDHQDLEGHTTCPICLSPPSAPRMTKCGHVFCYPCVLHYLSTSDHAKWHRCPICFDSIHERQLKSVKWFDDSSYDERIQSLASSSRIHESSNSLSPGSSLTMRLMERPQLTTLALPRSHTWPSDLIPPHRAPFHFLPDVFRYSRFMLATPDYLISDLSKDLDELASERRILNGMKDELGVSFIDLAESKIRQQIEKASSLETPELRETVFQTQKSLRDLKMRAQERENILRQNQGAVDTDSIPEALLDIQTPSTKPVLTRGQRSKKNVNPPPPLTSTYYFYQAASGKPIFLHPLDIRALLSNFQSYSAFPELITLRVEAYTEGSVDSDLRRRCKYLAHLPESADVVFVEADLTGLVSDDILQSFEGPLRARRSRRRERNRKDDRARARAEEREREKFRLPTTSSFSSFVGNTHLGYETEIHTSELQDEDQSSAMANELDSPLNTHVQTGAWGQRSFASAIINGRTRAGLQGSAMRVTADEDDWDVDESLHELEQRNGRRKRSNKLVVLGGTGGRRR